MFRALAKVVLAASLILPTAAPVIAGDLALTVYAGRVTEDHWFEALPPGVHFADAWFLVTAGRLFSACITARMLSGL